MLERNTAVEARDVSGFDRVVLRSSVCCAEVYIEQGDAESLIIEGGADVMPRIEAGVRNRTLILRLRGSWLEKLGDLITNDLTQPKMIFRLEVRDLRSLDVYGASLVHVPSLDTESLTIHWRGAGNFEIDSLIAQTLEVEQSGAGSMEFAGQVERQRVKLSGVGRFDASSLRSEHAEVQVTGSSYASVHATGTLKAVVHGVGVVEYRGDPLVRSRVTGVGSVVRIG